MQRMPTTVDDLSTTVYRSPMIEILKSDTFERWLLSLNDRAARARIQARIDRMIEGHFGDCKPVGEGVSEMRIFHDPDYRLYFIRQGRTVVVLLCGGDKSTQAQDIERAKALATDWRT